MTTSINLTSPKSVVYSAIEYLIMMAPRSVKGPSVQDGLFKDLSKVVGAYIAADEESERSPEYVLELYALKKLSLSAYDMFRHYRDDNFEEALSALQGCCQAVLLLKAPPDKRYVTLNSFVAMLMVVMTSLTSNLPSAIGTVFTRNAMLAMAYDIILQAREDYEQVFADYSLETMETHFQKAASQLMIHFAENLDRKFVPSVYAEYMPFVTPHEQVRAKHAVNALNFSIIAVDYGNSTGYFGLEGTSILSHVLEVAVETLITR